MGIYKSKFKRYDRLPTIVEVRSDHLGPPSKVEFFPRVLRAQVPGIFQLMKEAEKIIKNSRKGAEDEQEKNPESSCEIQNFRMLTYVPELPYMIQYAQDNLIPEVDFMYIMEMVFLCRFVDRTSTLTGKIKIKVLDPIPDYDPNFKFKLEQVCLRRARELANLAKQNNQHLYLLWSGGIDSTAALVAFMQILPSEELKQILTVCCTKISIKEYPLFYYKYQKVLTFKEYPTFELFPQITQNEENNKYMIVTGDHGDQIFGSDFMINQSASKTFYIRGRIYKNYLYDCADKDWRTFMSSILEESGALPRGYGKAWVEWMSPQVQKCPIPIVNMFDYLWWINFSMKWQQVKLLILWKLGIASERSRLKRGNIYEFYCTEDFQQWSFHNHELKFPDKNIWSTYKWPLKQFIFDYVQDQSYLKHKTKEKSLRMNFRWQRRYLHKYVGINENYELVGWGEYSQCITAMKQKYGPKPLASLLNNHGKMAVCDYSCQSEEQQIHEKVVNLQKKTLAQDESVVVGQGIILNDNNNQKTIDTQQNELERVLCFYRLFVRKVV
eukprot:TRINITY_DN3196_c0_g1_i7.p1 TRINITY_DN3196_c0_g1~~TRINITY_DN3196_c0_g1_i7.p1  ORF type:complete len:581 (+),score=35.99 TRINITY_DN3196_c0_g1_i7:85-1743(+)